MCGEGYYELRTASSCDIDIDCFSSMIGARFDVDEAPASLAASRVSRLALVDEPLLSS